MFYRTKIAPLRSGWQVATYPCTHGNSKLGGYSGSVQVSEWQIHPHYGTGGKPIDWDNHVFGVDLKSKSDFGKQARQRICI
jgi:hypothetical protein